MHDQRAAEQRQQEQAGAAQAAECGQAIIQAALLAYPAAGEKTGETVAGGRDQAGRGTEQQFQVGFDRPGTGQHGHAKQAKRHPGGLAEGQRLGKEQHADQHAHHRRRRIEDRRVAGRQYQRRQAIHGRRQPGVDHPEHQALLELAAKVPLHPHDQQDRQQPERAQAGAEERGWHAAEYRRDDPHE
ncbi:hypothetical protein D9M68_721730 [compost metagenome]